MDRHSFRPTGITFIANIEHNLQLLKERHNLQSPVYIGDTEGDRRATHKAGMPFVLMTYGFGDTDKYDIKFDNFVELTDYYMNL